MFWTWTCTCVHVHVLFMFSKRNIFQNMKFEISEHEKINLSKFNFQSAISSHRKKIWILDEKNQKFMMRLCSNLCSKTYVLERGRTYVPKIHVQDIIWNMMFRTWLNICSEKSCSRTWFWTWIMFMFMFCSCSWKPRNMGNSAWDPLIMVHAPFQDCSCPRYLAWQHRYLDFYQKLARR